MIQPAFHPLKGLVGALVAGHQSTDEALERVKGWLDHAPR